VAPEINIRLDVPLLPALRARADAEGVSLNVLCRTLLQDGLRRALPSESERTASVEEELHEGLGDLDRRLSRIERLAEGAV
jgi:hypothetical protein